MRKKAELEGTGQYAFRMTDTEYNTIREKAKTEGMTINRYVVDTLIKNDMRAVMKKLYNTTVYANIEKRASEKNKSVDEFLKQFNIETKERARELNMPLDKYIELVLSDNSVKTEK